MRVGGAGLWPAFPIADASANHTQLAAKLAESVAGRKHPVEVPHRACSSAFLSWFGELVAPYQPAGKELTLGPEMAGNGRLCE